MNKRCTDTLLDGLASRRGHVEHRIARPLGCLAQTAQLAQPPVLHEHREENLVVVDAEVVDAGRHVAFDASTALALVTFQSEDHQEALAALREKRLPVFKDR